MYTRDSITNYHSLYGYLFFFVALNHLIQIQVEGVAAGEELNPGCSLNMGLKRKTTTVTKDITNTQLLTVPGPTPRRPSAAAESKSDLEAKGSAVKDLFEGNYEERRKFGVVDIFDTLGFAVSNQC